MENATKKCKICGKDFVPDKHSHIYCSDGCRKVASRDNKNKSRRRRYDNGSVHSEMQALTNDIRRQRAKEADARLAMRRRLAERDAAYAAAFPSSASGSVRGRVGYAGSVHKSNYLVPIR